MRIRSCKDKIRNTALLLLAIPQVIVGTLTTWSSIINAAPSTCPSRSINYITQTLPQQCLTSSWSSKPIAQTQTIQNFSSNGAITTSTTGKSPSSVLKSSARPVVSTVYTAQSESTLTAEASAPELSTAVTTDEPSKKVEDIEPIPESDSESPLDNVNFLSFEEWKHQNLAKAGQSAENLGSKDGGTRSEPRRRPGMQNALDSLGDDSEIDIDFGGFVNAGGMNDALPAQTALPDGAHLEGTPREDYLDDLSRPRRRGKDAGKTCKERSNYASFDCAATALKTNPECKGSTSVLVENKDSYMLNVCAVKNKYLIVELCDAILIDTVVLANFEYFSSMFRTFRVSVSDKYPVKMDKWKELGTYEARNSREVQAFLVENPLIWAKYLRVEFLTQYGNEYYCPVSLLRVHGTTMMEEFNHEVKGSRGDDDSEDVEIEEESVNPVQDTVSAEALKLTTPAASDHTEEATPSKLMAAILSAAEDDSTPSLEALVHIERPVAASEGFTPYQSSISKELEEVLFCKTDVEHRCSPVSQSGGPTVAPPNLGMTTHTPESAVDANKSAIAKDTNGTLSHSQKASPQSNSTASANSTMVPLTETSAHASVASAVSSTGVSNNTATNSVKVVPSSTQPSPANPTTQESFFKSVHKRLQLLEANSTLSLQYIEEQSRMLRDAFSKVEKRQLSKTSNFLETLNTTVLTELREFRMQYDQIWQSTVLELSSQREQSAHEVSALSARLIFLTDEIVFQKRMVMLQFVLILLCLGLVIFTRYGGASTYLELPPLVQNAIGKSSANLSRYTHFETPPASPPSTRPPSRYGRLFRGLKHHRSPSDLSDLNGDATSPTIAYSPPTPESQASRGDRNTSPSADESETLSDTSPIPDEDGVREARGSSAGSSRAVQGKCRVMLDSPLLTPKPNITSHDQPGSPTGE